VVQPEVLMLDEPPRNLDANLRAENALRDSAPCTTVVHIKDV